MWMKETVLPGISTVLPAPPTHSPDAADMPSDPRCSAPVPPRR